MRVVLVNATDTCIPFIHLCINKRQQGRCTPTACWVVVSCSEAHGEHEEKEKFPMLQIYLHKAKPLLYRNCTSLQTSSIVELNEKKELMRELMRFIYEMLLMLDAKVLWGVLCMREKRNNFKGIHCRNMHACVYMMICWWSGMIGWLYEWMQKV